MEDVAINQQLKIEDAGTGLLTEMPEHCRSRPAITNLRKLGIRHAGSLNGRRSEHIEEDSDNKRTLHRTYSLK